MRRMILVLIAIALAGGVMPLWATPITYTETVTGSGSLGSSSFANAIITLMLSGNTYSVVMLSPGVFRSGAGAATVSISGIGTAALTDDVEAVVNQAFSIAGISDLTSNLGMVFTANSVFSSYALQTSLGPVSGTGSFSSGPFPTSSGIFTLNTISGNSTFNSALSAVPELPSIVMLGTSFIGLAILQLRRKRI